MYASHVLEYDLVRQVSQSITPIYPTSTYQHPKENDMDLPPFPFYPLFTQVRETMNQEIKIMPGVWSPSFIGESQHATATHVAKTENHKQSLDILRRDIRR